MTLLLTKIGLCQYQEEKSMLKRIKLERSRSGDCVFRSYRFAMTTTGEYSNYHGAFSNGFSSGNVCCS